MRFRNKDYPSVCLAGVAGLLMLPGVALAQAGPPPSVVIAPVVVQDVAPVNSYIGYVQAIQSVTIMARVAAFIDKVDFVEGSMVKSGQVLFDLQRAPYQAALDSAQASLEGAQATLRNAQLTYDRDTQLTAGTVVSQSQVDTALATRDADSAAVLTARANLETAAINLSYTSITSPIDGRIGKTTYTQGNLVGPTSSALATVVQVDPIRVEFAVADGDIVSALLKSHKSQAELEKEVVLDLLLSNGQRYDQTGHIEFLNNQVDTATGTVTVWARFPNPDGLLVPGAFATVQVHQATPDQRPVVPLEAVQDDKQGEFVLLVGPDNKVRQQAIATGAQLGQDLIVTAGLKGGEDVIVQGEQKVKAGEVVNPVKQTPASQAQQSAPTQSASTGGKN